MLIEAEMQRGMLKGDELEEDLMNAGKILHIVSVYGTEITDVHPLEDVLLLGCH